MSNWFAVPVLNRRRIWFAFIVAAITDTLQLVVGPAGWFFFDEGLDVLAMMLTSAALGFHMLLLPTFVIEFIPVADMLPTWTGCVAAVVMLRRKVPPPGPPKPAKTQLPPSLPPAQDAPGSSARKPQPESPVIDI